VASKRLLGCACIFSGQYNGILGGHRIGRVIQKWSCFFIFDTTMLLFQA